MVRYTDTHQCLNGKELNEECGQYTGSLYDEGYKVRMDGMKWKHVGQPALAQGKRQTP